MFGKKIKKIAVTAPAGRADDDFEFIKILLGYGYKVVLGESLKIKSHPYFSATDKFRAKELENFFADESIDLIISYRGGYGSLRLLPYLNLTKMAQSQAYFIGYSDITILLCQLASYGYEKAIIAPMAKSLAKLFSLLTQESLLACFDDNYQFTFNYLSSTPINLKGQLLPMNLTSLQSLIGTIYMPSLAHKIILLEDINEAEYKIDRMLQQLILASDLNKATALFLGEFSGTTETWFIDDLRANLTIPVYTNFPFSHQAVINLALPFGKKIVINNISQMLTMQSF